MNRNYLLKMSQKVATPVSLRHLFLFGKLAAKDPEQRLRNAQFLHNELQIRIAQRVVELESLPLGISETSHLRSVVGWYQDYFDRLAEFKYPKTTDEELAFSDLLQYILQDNSAVIETTSRGVIQIRANKRGFDVDDQKVVDKALSRFYLARIGLRFLIEHHIKSRIENPDIAGIIESSCCPRDQIISAYEESRHLCEYFLGVCPELEFENVNDAQISFTYLPSHLHYMLTELLKNSCKATIESHPLDPPPIKVLIIQGKNDVTIRVSDRGGGIDRAELPKIWSFLYSSVKDEAIQQQLLEDEGRAKSVLAGYGVGLPLSRLYSRYFGGDLDIKSLHGYGTDAFLHLPRLGHNCENLPDVVGKSPAMGTSSLQRGNSQLFFFGNRNTWEENIAVGQSSRTHNSTGDA